MFTIPVTQSTFARVPNRRVRSEGRTYRSIRSGRFCGTSPVKLVRLTALIRLAHREVGVVCQLRVIDRTA